MKILLLLCLVAIASGCHTQAEKDNAKFVRFFSWGTPVNEEAAEKFAAAGVTDVLVNNRKQFDLAVKYGMRPYWKCFTPAGPWRQVMTPEEENLCNYINGKDLDRKMPYAERQKIIHRRRTEKRSQYGGEAVVHPDPLTSLGGEIIGESVHWLDLACWFFAPQLPCEITAWGSSRLSHGIHLRFDRGASMTLDFSCSGTFDFPKELYEVTDNAALFRSLHFVENNYYGMPENEPEFFELQSDPFPDMGRGFEAFQAKYSRNVAGSTNAKIQENTTPLAPDKGHRAMLNAFIRCLKEDQPSPCDELAGFRSTYLAQRAIQALEMKRTLSVPLEKITPCIQ